MKKIPLVLIMFLIFIALVMGIEDSSKYSGGKDVPHDLLSKYPSYIDKAGGPAMPSDNSVLPRDEKSFLTDNIRKSEEMTFHLEEAVQSLKSEGNDVQELEEMVDTYTQMVSQSRYYLSMAENSSSPEDKQKYYSLSKDKMILADMELKEIFNTLQSYLPGPLNLVANESLNASGSGIVILSGDLDLAFSMSNGKFTIVDFTGDLDIDADKLYGSEVQSGQVMIPENDTMQQMVSYDNVQGYVTLSGSVLTVAIMSNDINLDVTGMGKAELYGNGTYLLTNNGTSDEGIWIPSLFDPK